MLVDKSGFEVLIGLGSNLGDRMDFLRQTIPELRALGITPVSCAQVYETNPIGGCHGQFLNSVLLATSSLSPEKIMMGLLVIERKLGRVRQPLGDCAVSSLQINEPIAADRCIDLDLLMMRDLSGRVLEWKTPQLQLPHPRMHCRSFVLIPAAEVAGDWQFPASGLTIAQLRAKLADQLIPYANNII